MDFQIVEWFQAHQSASVREVMRGVSFLGSAEMCCTLAVIIGLLLYFRKGLHAHALFLACGTWGGALVCEGLKLLFHRRRPFQGRFIHSYSFPSNHVFSTTVFCTLLIFIIARQSPALKRPLASIAAAWIILVGFSRVYLGAHWPTDVVFAVPLAGIYLWIVAVLFKSRLPLVSE